MASFLTVLVIYQGYFIDFLPCIANYAASGCFGNILDSYLWSCLLLRN
jgi:hypothetical protein